jgi:excisionase family DNA binding protein
MANHSPVPPAGRPQPDFLTVKQVAKYLQISVRSVWRWSSSGKLPRPIRLSATCHRWRRSDVERAISQAQAESA